MNFYLKVFEKKVKSFKFEEVLMMAFTSLKRRSLSRHNQKFFHLACALILDGMAVMSRHTSCEDALK